MKSLVKCFEGKKIPVTYRYKVLSLDVFAERSAEAEYSVTNHTPLTLKIVLLLYPKQGFLFLASFIASLTGYGGMPKGICLCGA